MNVSPIHAIITVFVRQKVINSNVRVHLDFVDIVVKLILTIVWVILV